jgi:hypothetical protein
MPFYTTLFPKTTKDQCESCWIISEDMFETDDDEAGIFNRNTKVIKNGAAAGPKDTEQSKVLSSFSHLDQLLPCSCAVRDNTVTICQISKSCSQRKGLVYNVFLQQCKVQGNSQQKMGWESVACRGGKRFSQKQMQNWKLRLQFTHLRYQIKWSCVPYHCTVHTYFNIAFITQTVPTPP